MRTFTAVLALAIVSAPCVAQPSAERPNVVLIITDDVGYGDIGVYGAPDVKTPNIDRLAREGVRLTDFYANGSTCTPTRTGLITGRYQQRFTLELPLGARGRQDLESGLAPTGRSLPQLLKSNGYATALVGKWHLGWRPEFSPRAHGFDYFFGFKSGYIDYYQHTSGGDIGSRPDLFENDSAVTVPGYMTDLITERSIRFIEGATKPFFLEVAYNAAHWPYQRPDHPTVARDNSRHLGPFDDSTSTRADYIAVLERADQGVGRILAALDRQGLRRNTIVIFTNDNGGEWLSRNDPLFHHKGSIYEGGIRVPAIVRWPARIRAGRVSRQVGITMDLTASILSVTGSSVPADTKLEGVNLFPVLEGRAPEIERTLFWRTVGRAQLAARWGNWKLMQDGPRAMLFDLRADMSERTNLIGRRPDIARRLRDQLREWQADVDAEARRQAPAGLVSRLGAPIDHIILGIDSLERGVRLLREATGGTAQFGGVHPGRGTQNALLSLGTGVYLELIAPNFADTARASRVTFFSQFRALTPYGWAVQTRNADSLIAFSASRGLWGGQAFPGSRVRPDGSMLTWRSVVPWGMPRGPHLPFFIEWGAATAHPSSDSPSTCALAAVRMVSSSPDSLASLLARADVRVPVMHGTAEGLQFELECPRGRVVFR